MGFSLLSWSEFLNREINSGETKNHLLCRWNSNCYTKKSPFRYDRVVQATIVMKGKVILMANKTNDMAHTKWMCKYHIVFTPKYRRKVIYNQYKADIRDILKDYVHTKV